MKSPVTLSSSERANARTKTSAFSARRSSRPKHSVTEQSEVLLLAQDSKRVFIQNAKSDVTGRHARPNYTMIDGVPHTVCKGRYVKMISAGPNRLMELVNRA